jgi:hypothetical protein
MSTAKSGEVLREAVGYFKSADELQEAIDDLMSSGFDRAQLELLASEEAVEQKLGHHYRRVSEIADDPKVPRVCYVSDESVGAGEGALIGTPLYIAALVAGGAIVATGGTVLAAFAGAAMAGTAGGLAGAALAKYVGDEHAEHIEEQLRHGGLLLWVTVQDRAHEERAVEILKKHSGRDVHLHQFPAAA